MSQVLLLHMNVELQSRVETGSVKPVWVVHVKGGKHAKVSSVKISNLVTLFKLDRHLAWGS